MLDARSEETCIEDASNDDVPMSLAKRLDVSTSCDWIVLDVILEVITVPVLILLAFMLDMLTLSEGTNCPFVDVTNIKLLETGISLSCNK